MLAIIDLPFKIRKEKVIKELKKNILKMLNFAFIVCVCLSVLFPQIADASTIVNEKLIEKISKDYTNKFCNSIAFGLSKESAMEFSAKENNLIFRNRKGFDDISSDLIANKIAISVVEDCGYLIDLRGNDGINGFENDYKILLKKAQIKTN